MSGTDHIAGRPPHRRPPRSSARSGPAGAVVLLALAATLVLATAATAAETQVYLAWGSPFGTPGARDTLVRACGDSTRVDTLFLSFEAGEDFRTLVAISGDLELAPVSGDTLSSYWSFRSESTVPGSIRGEFAGSGRAGCPFPWSAPGMPVVGLLRRDGLGLIRLLYAVATTTPATVLTGERYCFARILIRHRAGDDPGCAQALRVTWGEAEFGDYPDTERRVLSGRKRPVYLLPR